MSTTYDAPVATGDATREDLRTAALDWTTLVGRSLRHVRRNTDALLISVALPVLIMLLFVHVFGGGMQTGTEHYVDYVVPGVLLLCTGYGAANTAVAVAEDMRNGVIDRFRSMPIARSAVLAGHVVGSLARNLLATTLVVLTALLIGWEPTASLLDWVVAAGLLMLYVAAFSWVAAAVGLLVRSTEAAGGFTFFALFLPYVSSGFLPTSTMPDWLRVVADHQPVTPVTEALRSLLMGTGMGDHGLLALAWCLGLGMVGAITATWLFARGRRTS